MAPSGWVAAGLAAALALAGSAHAQTSGDLADLAAEALPAVVAVSAERPQADTRGLTAPGLPGPQAEDFLERFFGDREGFAPPGMPDLPFDLPDEFLEGRDMPGGSPQTASNEGAGFIIDPQGYVVTRHALVAGADAVTVTLADGTEFDAAVVGTDQPTDLALLKIESDRRLPSLAWGDSGALRVGDPVLALGQSPALGGTASAGIVFAAPAAGGAGSPGQVLHTDVLINQHNDGGPMLDRAGNVVGVSTSDDGSGMGTAIASAIASPIIEELRRSGTVRRGWLGVSIQPVTDDIAVALGLDAAEGALVSSVVEGSPAEEAGIETGDVILSFNDEAVAVARDLPALVTTAPLGEAVPITVFRDGDEVTLTAEIGLAPGAERQQAAAEAVAEDAVDVLGLSVTGLTPGLRDRFGLDEQAEGVLVVGVAEKVAAAGLDLAAGDLILEVNRQDVSEPEQVVAAVDEARRSGARSVLLLRERAGDQLFVPLPIETQEG